MPVSKFDQMMMEKYGGNGVSNDVKSIQKERSQPKPSTRGQVEQAARASRVCAQGVVKQWGSIRGFGFITSDAEESIIFHKDAINFSPEVGMRVSFTAVKTSTGRLKALNVSCISAERVPVGNRVEARRRFQATGVVTSWKAKQDMGFITTDTKEVVVCFKTDNGVGALQVGARVSFTALSKLSGGFKAVDVKVIRNPDPCRRIPFQERKHGGIVYEQSQTQQKVCEPKRDLDEQSEVSTAADTLVDAAVLAQLG